MGQNKILMRKKDRRTIDSFGLEQMLINIYDHTAIATFICIVHGKYDQTPYTRKSRFYDVLVKRNGVWKAVASHVIQGLPVASAGYNEVKQNSTLWQASFNARDSLAFYSLFDSSAIFVSGGARRIGKEECISLFRRLYVARPDIRMYNSPSSIEVNERWQVAFETGDWTEKWTEKGDKDFSQLKGKYSIMWRYSEGSWRINTATFTPLSCSGNYCNKR
jgi:ketosteroid isomerase-like protein